MAYRHEGECRAAAARFLLEDGFSVVAILGIATRERACVPMVDVGWRCGERAMTIYDLIAI